ncbi:MAG: pantetheine-phosphate adenylyltransferase [Bdellovibrionales bacterium]|nr:pantetheine-phosphate adenylyltransferase [Bdellovibrionales bacterium]
MEDREHKALQSTIAIYPGSFDPITMGHVDLIVRLADFYQEIIVLVANSMHKSYMFTSEERKKLVKESLPNQHNVRVADFDGLTVDYARKAGAKVILRGLRAVADFEYEFAMANMNRKLAPEIETKIVFTRPEYSFVSSRMVKEVALCGGTLKELVPQPVVQALQSKIYRSR